MFYTPNGYNTVNTGRCVMDNKPNVNIGVQRFDRIREQNSFYIDKTGLIKEWWETGSDVTLITPSKKDLEKHSI